MNHIDLVQSIQEFLIKTKGARSWPQIDLHPNGGENKFNIYVTHKEHKYTCSIEINTHNIAIWCYLYQFPDDLENQPLRLGDFSSEEYKRRWGKGYTISLSDPGLLPTLASIAIHKNRPEQQEPEWIPSKPAQSSTKSSENA